MGTPKTEPEQTVKQIDTPVIQGMSQDNEVMTIWKKMSKTQLSRYQRQMETSQSNLKRRLSPVSKGGNRRPEPKRRNSPDTGRRPYQETLPEIW